MSIFCFQSLEISVFDNFFIFAIFPLFWPIYPDNAQKEGIEIQNNNTTIWARLYDGHNAGGHAAGKVTKIDKKAPDKLEVTTTTTTNSITVTATAKDATKSNDSGCFKKMMKVG